MNAENLECEYMVQQASSDNSSTCTPSTSGSSTPSYCTSRRMSRKLKRKISRSHYLLAIEGRNRLRKLAARKVKLASNAVSALSLLRWEEKIDRKYEKKYEEKRVSLQQLMQENDVLRANRRMITEGCNVLENYTMALQVRLEQEVHESIFGFSSQDDFFSPHS